MISKVEKGGNISMSSGSISLPVKHLGKFVQLFDEGEHNFGTLLPNPRMKRAKKAGAETYYYLCWEGKDSAGQ